MVWVLVVAACIFQTFCLGLLPQTQPSNAHNRRPTLFSTRICVANKAIPSTNANASFAEKHSRPRPGHRSSFEMLRRQLLNQAKEKNAGALLRTFKHMREKGLSVDTYLCNLALNACRHQNDVHYAKYLYAFMQRRNIERTAHTHTTMMALYGDIYRWREALDILQGMQDEGVEPTWITYKTAVSACTRSSRLAEATELMAVMKARHLTIDSQTYVSCVLGAVSTKQFETALTFLEQLLHEENPNCTEGPTQKVIDPPLITYLLKNLATMHEYAFALRLCALLRNRGHAVPVQGVNSLISEAADHTPEEALRLLAAVLNESWCVPNVATYNTAIKACAKMGSVEQALRVYRMLISRSITPDAYTYTTLLSLMAKNDNCDGCYMLLNNMKRYNVTISAQPYIHVINAFSRAMRPIQAVEIFEMMRSNAVAPDTTVYNSVILAHSRSNNLTGALHFLGEMKQSHLQPNNFTHACILRAYSTAGDLLGSVQHMNSLLLEFDPLFTLDTSYLRNRPLPLQFAATITSKPYVVLATAPSPWWGVAIQHDDSDGDGVSYRLLKTLPNKSSKRIGVEVWRSALSTACDDNDLFCAHSILQTAEAYGYPLDIIMYSTLLDACLQNDLPRVCVYVVGCLILAHIKCLRSDPFLQQAPTHEFGLGAREDSQSIPYIPIVTPDLDKAEGLMKSILTNTLVSQSGIFIPQSRQSLNTSPYRPYSLVHAYVPVEFVDVLCKALVTLNSGVEANTLTHSSVKYMLALLGSLGIRLSAEAYKSLSSNARQS